ncbi:sin3 histone deacetylase corepressor complex component SDS3 isoform X5 [Tachypleus tridentatus]|uniref:sin3 histone deacetylase corepressor complex component SDS3 isoform X5 n=1 Tax=Tachypleus tridentatus TaxID=6853 RepID=UPI003FD4CB1B
MIVIKTFIMSEYDFDDNSREFDADRDSDEDTEDASETDMAKQEQEYTEIKEQMYQDKLANLKKQLQQLQDETHPEYLRRLKKLEQAYQERLFLNEAFQCYEIERVEAEYISEKKAAVWEFEDKKVELRENLIAELEEKKRIIENERSNIELTGGKSFYYSIEVKPVTTRKLRRRPNEPLPVPEKRRKASPEGKLSPVGSKQEGNETVSHCDHSGSAVEAKIEDGKLYYEKKWYFRGQPVFIENKDVGKFNAVISTVASSEIWVKRVPENSKLRIHLSQFQKGKYSIRRRTP